MRLDKLLCFLRLTKTRGQAQALVADGHIRLNGRRVERTSQAVAAGDIIVIPLPRGVLALEVTALPLRRGPPDEARGCYRVLD